MFFDFSYCARPTEDPGVPIMQSGGRTTHAINKIKRKTIVFKCPALCNLIQIRFLPPRPVTEKQIKDGTRDVARIAIDVAPGPNPDV